MKILFVCSGNAYRSPVAEALMKKLKPEIEADSAGTDPAIPISEIAKQYLEKESAIKYLKATPEGLNEKDLSLYDLIIAMKPKHMEAILRICPRCKNKILLWDIDDPYFLPHKYAKEVFGQIHDKVLELIDSL